MAGMMGLAALGGGSGVLRFADSCALHPAVAVDFGLGAESWWWGSECCGCGAEVEAGFCIVGLGEGVGAEAF